MIEIKQQGLPLLSNVKSIFLNPYHFTYIIHKEDHYIYLYDEVSMEIIGKTKTPFYETIKSLAFTDNFNQFCAYFESKAILFFKLELDGLISHKKITFQKGANNQLLTILSIAFIQKEKLLAGITKSKIFFLDSKTQEIIKTLDLNFNLNPNGMPSAMTIFPIKNQIWIFLEDRKLIFMKMSYFELEVIQEIKFNEKLMSIFLDVNSKRSFLCILTEFNNLIILKRIQEKEQQKWVICFKFSIVNYIIRKLCFFSPGIDTSTTNKYKDKIFFVVIGEPNRNYNQKQVNYNQMIEESEEVPQVKFAIPKDQLQSKSIYIFEFDRREMKGYTKVAPKKQFWIRNVSNILYLWTNQHEENTIRILTDERVVKSIDLISLLDGLAYYIGKEWVALGYKFEPINTNLVYEEKEEQFENQPPKPQQKMSFQELNDWSFSLFSKETFLNKSIKRINCIQF